MLLSTTATTYMRATTSENFEEGNGNEGNKGIHTTIAAIEQCHGPSNDEKSQLAGTSLMFRTNLL